MAAGGTDPESYYRIYKALHLVTHEAISCVDKCLTTWHSNQTLPSCTGQCPTGKKPKSPASCQACVNWGQAVEGALYQPPANPSNQPSATAASGRPQIAWTNVNSSKLGNSHVEVAKAFVLRLPHKSTSGSTYNHVSDFDSASLLMIMAKFTMFHYGTKSNYDIIMKVSLDYRSSLA